MRFEFDTEKEANELAERKVGSEEVFGGKLMHVFLDTVTLPNGETATREYNRHVGAVAVVALTDDGKVIVERQFRYPLGKVITEIPAGKLDGKDEDRLEAAKRELREETGITADDWTALGDLYPTPAYTDEVITMFLARGLHYGERKLDEDEFLNVITVPLSELIEEIVSGKIADSKTQAAVLKTAFLLEKRC